jgi:hypothetical protein
MSDKRTSPHQPGLLIGIILVSLGGVLLALKLGMAVPWELWKYFPVPFMALGVWGLVQPNRFIDRMGGLWFLTFGIYALIGTFKLFGLDWWSAWPVYVIAAGLSVMFDHNCGACKKTARGTDGDS